MNNKPVAWRYRWKNSKGQFFTVWQSCVEEPITDEDRFYFEPLYTHPVKEQKCSTCDGTGDVHSIDGQWLGECPWCTHPAELTEEEIISIGEQYWNGAPFKFVEFARAILRKAQEK